MAPEAEKNDIKRQQKMLREDVAAAKREQQLSAGTDATATAETRARVRELLETLRTTSEAEMTELTSLFEAVSMVEKAEMNGKGGQGGHRQDEGRRGEPQLSRRGQASRQRARRWRSSQRRQAARRRHGSASGRRAASSSCSRSWPALPTRAPPPLLPPLPPPQSGPRRRQNSRNGEPEPSSLSDEAKAARSVWAMRIGKLLCHASSGARSSTTRTAAA